jgi:hypothetical protein
VNWFHLAFVLKLRSCWRGDGDPHRRQDQGDCQAGVG